MFVCLPVHRTFQKVILRSQENYEEGVLKAKEKYGYGKFGTDTDLDPRSFFSLTFSPLQDFILAYEMICIGRGMQYALSEYQHLVYDMSLTTFFYIVMKLTGILSRVVT